MRSSIAIAAVLMGALGSAQAQANYTLFGRADATVGKPIGSAYKGVYQGKGSLLGLTGDEDLGGGTHAFFQLYSDIFLQNGGALSGDGSYGKAGFWGSRSIVGIKNGAYMIDAGRKLTPAWVVALNADPWGTYSYVTVNTTGLFGAGLFSSARNQGAVSVNYAADGFFAGLQVADNDPAKVVTRGGGPTPVPNMPSIVASGSRPVSLGLGYNKGSVYVGLGYEATGYNTKALLFTSTYDFGPAKVWLGLGSGHHSAVGTGVKDLKGRNLLIGLTVPVARGEIRAGYDVLQTQQLGSDGSYAVMQVVRSGQLVDAYPNNSRKLGLGYLYPLSKRTEVFGNVTHDSKAYVEKTGYDLGVTHHF